MSPRTARVSMIAGSVGRLTMGWAGTSSSVARTIVAESRNASDRPKRIRVRDDGSPPNVSTESDGGGGSRVTNVLKTEARFNDWLRTVPVSGTSTVT
jgi:hypothetical protein